MNSSIEIYLNRLVSEKLGVASVSFQCHAIGGGSINETYRITVNHGEQFFLKLNSATKYPRLFQKEKNGLQFLGKQKIIHVPDVIACDETGNYQILLLEWIEGGIQTEKFWDQFGEQLAKLHRITNPHFGFAEDNYMGALPQQNKMHENWIEFFRHHRLEPQIKWAEEKLLLQAKHVSLFENLYDRLPNIFNAERPALLHGDLWSGNYMCNENAEPVLIDPAVYFGHRSMDLAMTTLFVGFDKVFYESYNYHFAFPKNYREQWDICNLYPLLIHLNLFGSGYLGQIENTLQKFR